MIWKKPEHPIPIGECLPQLGVFVWIDRPWSEHPFLYNKFRITTEEQLQQVLALGSDRVYWIPSKSTSEPAPAPAGAGAAPEQARPAAAPPPTASVRQRDEKLERQRAIVNRAERAYDKAAQSSREALLGMRDNPRQAAPKLRELTASVAEQVANSESILLLLGDKHGHGPQYHALNCMTLSVLVAKALGLPTAAVGEIALGALAHDVGLVNVPPHIVRSANRNRAEENLYREHCRFGVELARSSGGFSESAIAALQDHHEALDGSGFPAGKKGNAIGLAARIVGVVNRYDRLCHPDSPETRAMLPTHALKKLWQEEQSRFDARILAAMVSLLGVYPPGTIVALSDGSLGLVLSPGADSKTPKVLIYDPAISKDDAPVVDLGETPELTIEEALRPEDVPEEALQWINPRERLTYFFTADPKG